MICLIQIDNIFPLILVVYLIRFHPLLPTAVGPPLTPTLLHVQKTNLKRKLMNGWLKHKQKLKTLRKICTNSNRRQKNEKKEDTRGVSYRCRKCCTQSILLILFSTMKFQQFKLIYSFRYLINWIKVMLDT